MTSTTARGIHPGWAATAAFFAGLVLLMTLSPDTTPNTTNLVPFREHGAAWSCLLRNCAGAADSARFLVRDVLGNVAVFVPIGLAVAAALRGSRRRRLSLATLAGFLLSLFIETVQFGIATRATDVDDLIFNTLGALLGAGTYALLRGRANRPAARPLPPSV